MNPIQENSTPDDSEFDGSLSRRRSEPNADARLRRPEHIRTSRPNGFNGKHRRRNKRYTM